MNRSIYLIFVFLFSAVLSAQTAKLQIIHNSADIAADPVDIYVNGNLYKEDVPFRGATAFEEVPAGVLLNVGIALPNTSVNDTLKNFIVTLEAGKNYAAIASGVTQPINYAANPNALPTDFTLLVVANAKTEAQSNELVTFAIVHGSTDAPSVNIRARTVTELAEQAAYTDITGYIDVPAASYVLDVYIPGEESETIVASYRADLSELGGRAAIVFASGFLNPEQNQNGKGFGVFAALADGTVIEFPAASEARLQVIHNSADTAAEVVDLYVNGDLFVEDFEFRTATSFVWVPADIKLNIGVALPNTSVNDTLRNFNVVLENGNTYTAVANGIVNLDNYELNPDNEDISFTLFIKEMTREKAENSGVDFYVLHGSTDAPTVDVIARNAAKLVDDAFYGASTDYINVPAAMYTLDLTPGNDDSQVIASFDADLTSLEGGAAVVFASGFYSPNNDNNGPAFGLFAALPNGAVVEFGSVTSVASESVLTPTEFTLLQNYPNPFNPSTKINFSIPNNEFVSLKVFDILGNEIATLINQEMSSGSYSFNFDASNLPNGNTGLSSGIYLYQLKAGNFSQTRKMNLIK